jgi:hypothetical protein
MAVNASCAKCNVPLVDGILTLDDGTDVQISKCPSCEGKIKSPLCCSQDMACSAIWFSDTFSTSFIKTISR